MKEQAINEHDCIQTAMCERSRASSTEDRSTTISDDMNDLEPLTPNHLLLLKSQPNMPPASSTKTTCTQRKDGSKSSTCSDLFWTRWTREYLPPPRAPEMVNTKTKPQLRCRALVDSTSPLTPGSWEESKHCLIKRVVLRSR
ncbi:hypothetical protein AAFF_G00009970 [Aldrovandia affinis]|uniref:Uncharacterized protein n=1 Tax=Aldrovandia affinis TaxID=143900 RepID=A0AAD7S7B7_9TELE|nr:hypothetical protein AAFF_G00009970 [Aldrovandia affinis]